MKRLLAYAQGSTSATELDCNDASIEWSMSATEMSEPTRKQSPHSLTFALPFTHTNNRFFEHVYEVNQATNTWSHQVKTDVVVYHNTEEVFVGILQLLSVNVFTQEYECVIIGEAGSFFTGIRKVTWDELFTGVDNTTTVLDHVVSMTNVMDSWDVTNDITGGAGAGTIVYTIADNAEYVNPEDRNFMTAIGLTEGSSATGTPTPIVPQYCRPTIRVKWLWDYIFAYAGYTYDSTFLATDEIDKLYMVLGTEKENLPVRALYRARVAIGADQNPMSNDSWTNLSFVVETGDFYDPDGLVTGGNFQPTASGTYVLNVQVMWVSTGVPSLPVLHTKVRAMVGTTPFVASAYQLVSATTASSVIMTYQFTLVLSAGQSVAFQAKYETNATSPWYISSGSTHMTMGTYVSNAATIDIVEAMPDMTCEEFIRGIASEFNLSMVSDPDNPKNLIVEPMQDYLANYGSVKDWTDKVDLDKPIQLRPTTEEQPKRITFEDAQGGDFRNEWWQSKFGWVKGRKRFENPNEFAVRETEVGGVFAPYRLSPVPNGWAWNQQNGSPNFLILRLWRKREGKVRSSTSPPMLAFYHGLTSTSAIIYVTGGIIIDEVPNFTHISDSPAQDSSLNLRWGYDYPDHGNHPLVGFGGRYKYREWYSAYLESQYGEDSRILECEMWLTPSDVRGLTFADKLWVKDAYYRLYKLDNYVIGDTRSCRVKLWKVLDTTAYTCDLHPIGWQANGQVVFADESGTTTPATAACCLAADYYWDDAEGVCLWNYNSEDSQGFTDVDPTVGVTNYGNPGPPIAPSGIQATTDPTTGVIGTGSTWGVFGTTSGASNSVMQTAEGQDTFFVPNDAVALLQVSATTYQYDGTGGTIGDSSTVTQQSLITSNNGLYRVVSTSAINQEGTARSLNVSLTGAGIGELQVSAVGAANVDLYWYAQVQVLGMVIPEDYTPPLVSYVELAFNGDADIVQFNGAASTYAAVNGE